MKYTGLISVEQLASLADHDKVLIVDCRFDLGDTGLGRREFEISHLPGAVYADLDRDLSDQNRHGLGRHPFPSAAQFSRLLSSWGLLPGMQVVCYDGSNASMAARLWWMLRSVGHESVAVLDGGYAAWARAQLPLQTAQTVRTPSHVDLHFDPTRFVDFGEIAADRSAEGLLLIDARPGPRFRGELEPIDPVAGHVPGAINRPVADNLGEDACFKPAATLRAEFAALLQGRPARAVAAMCGSGVTACHNLLAMHHAGMDGARLFAPSWSGWISDPTRPVAIGP
jgi:thiosulfate/3-mercaptopyruvate sulfurtransferase